MKILSKIAEMIETERVGRVEAKAELDNSINLSHEANNNTITLSMDAPSQEEGYMTLLSEGAVLFRNGTIRLYIAKGTLQKFYDSIGDDYEGYISTGHRDLSAYPVREGYYRKEDLKLVVDENGRADLLVKPHVNTKMSNIRDIILQNEPFAISSEFRFAPKEIKEDELAEYAKLAAYNLSKGGTEDFPITDTLHIAGFSLVGNPGNAKSGGYSPSILLKTEDKENKVSKNSIIDNMLATLTGKTAEDEQLQSTNVDTKEEVTESAVEPEAETEVKETEELASKETAEDTTAALLEKANELIEALYAKNQKLEEELAGYKAKKEVSEEFSAAQKTQFDRLNGLLEKFNATVEEPKTASEKLSNDKEANIFGRESIWED